jgi:hypothetical protein
MLGYRFSHYTPPPEQSKSDFEKLLKIFMQLVLITAGNVAEALQWLTELDKQYKLTNDQYGIGDFIDQLKREGYITESGPNGENITPFTQVAMESKLQNAGNMNLEIRLIRFQLLTRSEMPRSIME